MTSIPLIRHAAGIIILFIILVLIRLPILLNSSSYLNADEAYNATDILDMMAGGPIFPHHEDGRYYGIVTSLTAIPFFKLLGETALAYKIPVVLHYSIYIWTLHLLAIKINRSVGILTLFLSIFTSNTMIHLTTQNLPHVMIALMGNLIFLQYMKIKSSPSIQVSDVFILGALSGFAIYTYSLALVYVLTIIILTALTHPDWYSFRSKLSWRKTLNLRKKTDSKRQDIARLLDIFNFLFAALIILSLAGGGLIISTFSYTIVHIQYLPKAFFQLFLLIALRTVVYREDISRLPQIIKKQIQETDPQIIQILVATLAGCILGLSPKLIGIFSQRIPQSLPGIEIKLDPINMATHAWRLFSISLPAILGSSELVANVPKISTFSGNALNIIFLTIPASFLIASGSYFYSHKDEFKHAFKLQQIKEGVHSLLIVLFLIFFISTIFTRKPIDPRHLVTLYGILIIWVAIYFERMKNRLPVVFTACLILWSGFYLQSNYKYYTSQSLVNGLKISEKRSHFYEIIDFCQSLGISNVYAEYWDAAPISFFSHGKLAAHQFYLFTTKGIAKKKLSLADDHFAIIVHDKKYKHAYANFLEERKIQHQKKTMDQYVIYWDFRGEKKFINQLRHLILWPW